MRGDSDQTVSRLSFKDADWFVAEGLALAECISRYDRIYLKGEPGSGKTTSLKHIALQCAEGEIPAKPGLSRNAIPLFVPLAEYEKTFEMESIPNPLDFVAAQARRHDCEGVEGFLADELRQGQLHRPA